MNDETKPRNRSAAEAPAEPGYADEPEFESSFSPGSVRFSSAAAEFGGADDFPPGSDGSGDSGEPGAGDEPGPGSEADADVEADVEAEAGAEAEEAAEPRSPDVFSRPAFYGEPKLTVDPGPAAEPEPRAEPEAPAEPGFRVTPAHSDAFSRPEYRARFTGPRPQPRRPATPEAGTEAAPLARPTFTPNPGYSAFPEPGDHSAADHPRSFARPSFTPTSGVPGEAKPAAERLYPFRQELRVPGEHFEAPAQPAATSQPATPEQPTAWPAAEAVTGTKAGAEPAAEAEPDAPAEAPAVTVEVPGRPSAQHPLRTSGELSVLRTAQPLAGVETRLPDSLWAYESYPVAENVPPADDQGGLVSLGYIGAAVKRKKKIWILTTALGVLVAAGLFGTYHAKYTDTATVMLALDPNLDPASAIQTDAILAVDSTMAQQAMRKLGVRQTVPDFLKTYTVTVSTTTNDLLTFTATGASATAAYNEANTLATTFLQYRAQTELAKESVNTSSQDRQVTQTRQTITSLKSQIQKLKQDGAKTGDSRLARLQNELTNAQTLLTSLQQTVASNEATLRSTTAALIAGSRVLDTGIPVGGTSKNKYALEYGGGAIFGGLVLGLLIAAISAIVSDRLRRRDDVAAALGAPVRVSVASGGKRSRKTDREADLKRVAAHLGAAVPSASDGAGSLVVVAVDETTFVSEAVREAAVSAAREGKRVVVADLAGGALSGLFGEKEPGIRPVGAGGVRVVLVIPERGDLAPVGPLHAPALGTPVSGVSNVHSAADVFITLATVNPAAGAAHLKTWGDDAVAVVTAGESSVTKVQAVGEMIRFADARLISAVLLGADEHDESLGYATA